MRLFIEDDFGISVLVHNTIIVFKLFKLLYIFSTNGIKSKSINKNLSSASLII